MFNIHWNDFVTQKNPRLAPLDQAEARRRRRSEPSELVQRVAGAWAVNEATEPGGELRKTIGKPWENGGLMVFEWDLL